MCGPSSGLKAINTATQNFATSARQEASTVFGDASTVFSNLMGPLQQIIKGGPGQAGYSAAELNAMNSQAITEGATEARNLGGAAASADAAIGGGNTVTASGTTAANVLAAKAQAASDTASAENQITQNNYAQGNRNFEAAVGQEAGLPNVFNAATSSEGEASTANANALKSQQAVDTQSNWWQPLVTAAISGAAGAATGGIAGGDGSGGGILSNFVQGGTIPKGENPFADTNPIAPTGSSGLIGSIPGS